MWAKAVETQMHFNEMSTKSRALGLTFVVSALGLAVFLIGKGDDWALKYQLSEESLPLPFAFVLLIVAALLVGFLFPIAVRRTQLSIFKRHPKLFLAIVPPLGVVVLVVSLLLPWKLQVPLSSSVLRIHVSVILVVASACALLLVRSLDLGVYHRMLRGAVAFGEDLEEKHLKSILLQRMQFGMTQAISHFSRHDDASFSKDETYADKIPGAYSGARLRTAEEKVRAFYYRTFVVLLVSAALLFFAPNVRFGAN